MSDFFRSLNEQTCKDFDVVVVNDGYHGVEKFINQYPALNIIDLPYNLCSLFYCIT